MTFSLNFVTVISSCSQRKTEVSKLCLLTVQYVVKLYTLKNNLICLKMKFRYFNTNMRLTDVYGIAIIVDPDQIAPCVRIDSDGTVPCVAA